MKSFVFISSLLSALSASATTVQINATSSYMTDAPHSTFKTLTVSLYGLNIFEDLSVSELALVQNQAIPADSIECRGYIDTQGLVGSTKPFYGTTHAYLSTNPVKIGAILCYATKPILIFV